MFAKWDKKLGNRFDESRSKSGRVLADASAGRCLKDRINQVGVHEEVQKQESAFRGSPINGNFHQLDLSTLPAAQGKFLSQDQDWTDAQIDPADCRDLPCVLDRIYSSANVSSSMAGQLIYGFYLRTGYKLATVPKVRDGIGKEPPLIWPDKKPGEYLFSEPELLAFWQMSFELPAAFWHLPNLSTIHRLPHNGLLTSWRGKDTPGSTKQLDNCGPETTESVFSRINDRCNASCGDTPGNKDWGYIRLSDDCMKLSESKRRGFFYIGFSHEIGHRIDYSLALEKSDGKWNYIIAQSEEGEWAAFSGWKHYFTLNPVTGRFENERWEKDPKLEGFARDYSATNAHEDWADSVSYFRYDPLTLKTASKKKYNFVSQKVYGGRTYTPEGLRDYYEGFVNRAAGEKLIEIANECTQPGATGEPDPAINLPLNFDYLLSDGSQKCVRQKLGAAIHDALETLRATEFEACDILDKEEQEYYPKTAASLGPELSKILQNEKNIQAVFEASKALETALSEELDAREAFIYCQKEDSPNQCYLKALTDGFNRVSAKFESTLGPVLGEISKRYLASHSFEETANAVASYFKQIFAGIDGPLLKEADSRWTQCLQGLPVPAATTQPLAEDKVKPAVEPVLTSPFSGGKHFVSAKLLNCLNGGAVDDVRKTRDRFLAKFGFSVFEPSAQIYTENFLMPEYLSAWGQRLEAAVQEEARNIETIKSRVADNLSVRLLADVGWVGQAVSSGEASSSCAESSEKIFPDVLNDFPELKSLNFSSIDEIRDSITPAACRHALNSAQVRLRVKSSYDAVLKDSMSQLEGMLTKRTDGLVQRCRDGYPGKGAPMKRKRRACVTDNWEKYEEQSIQEWLGTPVAKRLGSPRSDARQHLRNRRQALQNSALENIDP